LAAFSYTRPIPDFTSAVILPTAMRTADPPAAMPWPAQGQAALAVAGLGMVGSTGDTSPRPIASTAKLMTALVVVERHALAVGASGPSVAITQTDVDAYRAAVSQDQSSLPVQVGVPLTELQLLQGLLLPSANNYADILARWDAASVSAFVVTMNARAQQLGMNQTHFDDASGFSAKTVSTAPDLLLLAQAVMADPVLAGIAKLPQVTLPVAGLVQSTNLLLGDYGVIGLKTGNTDEAGGCFVFVASAGPTARPVTVLGVVLGQTDLAAAFRASSTLLAAVPSWLTTTAVVAKGDLVAAYGAPGGGTSRLVAAGDLSAVGWAGDQIQLEVRLDRQKPPLVAGTKVGELTATTRGQRVTVDILAADAIPSPSLWWRIWRN
jgi:D-alanyl-D-alanine carboxypeptidase (penicillin-binding protein 5/6)